MMLTIFSAIRRLWGSTYQNAEQKADMERVFAGVKGAGVLDYVTAWYMKAVVMYGTMRNVAAILDLTPYLRHAKATA